ncbi:MAG: hypothetical protein J6D06_05230 [Clostridia bacterium]|nr:hypothetical protein [Clostridia bacterium]
MYDLNLSVPDITSKKYSNDNRFLLLKNYLYELNETLSFALDSKRNDEILSLTEKVGSVEKAQSDTAYTLQSQSVSKFRQLKEDILRTAEEIERDYNSEITQSEQNILQAVEGSFVGKSEFGEYSSNVNTQLDQHAENIRLTAQNTETVLKELEEFKNETKASLTVQAEGIISQVETLYTSKSDSEDFESRINSQISQTAQNVTESFSQNFSAVLEDVNSLGAEVSELISSLDVYIRRGELEKGIYGIEIGRSDSNVKARFTNDKLSFFQGIVEVAYISGSTLYITNAEILDYMKIGSSADGYFLFDTTDNGLEVRWINGG